MQPHFPAVYRKDLSINTKLVLILTVTVGAVMLAASFISLRQREASFEKALRDELRAHGVTLQIALEENYRNGRLDEAQRFIDRLRENSRVYGALLFDDTGRLISASSQSDGLREFREPPELQHVIRTGETVEFFRSVGDERFLSIILPLRLSSDAAKFGAIEIVKPLALIEADISGARIRWLSTTLLLLATIFLVVYVVLRQSLSRPISALLAGARVLGSGDLSHRVSVPSSGSELEQLATEFNRMADSIEEQREILRSDAEKRLVLEKNLRHNERLASVGRLAAGIAHELGAPLNVIDARAEQLLENAGASRERQIKNLTAIRRQAARITHIVRQLLNLARPYDLRFQTIDLMTVIESSLDGVELNLERDVKTDGKAPYNISADADFLGQVFVNIFQNAAHAMASAGKLTVEVSKSDEKDSFIAVKISDTGPGIPAEDLDRIFDPFYTTKDVGQGTGLGLAVSRRIVEEHEGRIEVANGLGGGAVFTVYLPIIETT